MTFNDPLLLIFDLPKAQALSLFRLVDQPWVGSALTCTSPASYQSRPVTKKRQISIDSRIKKKNKRASASLQCQNKHWGEKAGQNLKANSKAVFSLGLSITMSSHTYKALIAHQWLLTVSKHRLCWIYRVTLDAHLYCSWTQGGTSAEGMFHFQCCTPLNIVWQPNPEDHRTKKGIYLLVLSFKCSDDWKIPGWLAQYVNSAH